MFYFWFHELCGDRPEYLNTETYVIYRNIHPDLGYYWDHLGWIIDQSNIKRVGKKALVDRFIRLKPF